MDSQLGTKRWTGNVPPSRVTEQQMKFFRVLPDLPSFFPPEFQQGGLQDDLGATRKMRQKGNPCWVAHLLHPKHLLELTLPLQAGRRSGKPGQVQGCGREYTARCIPRQSATNEAIRRHRHPLGCIAMHMAWVWPESRCPGSEGSQNLPKKLHLKHQFLYLQTGGGPRNGDVTPVRASCAISPCAAWQARPIPLPHGGTSLNSWVLPANRHRTSAPRVSGSCPFPSSFLLCWPGSLPEDLGLCPQSSLQHRITPS